VHFRALQGDPDVITFLLLLSQADYTLIVSGLWPQHMHEELLASSSTILSPDIQADLLLHHTGCISQLEFLKLPIANFEVAIPSWQQVPALS
jgi:hypothetical protein